MFRRVLVSMFLAAAVGCSPAADSGEPGTNDQSELGGDFRSDEVLPFSGNFLDSLKTLSRLNQFDRLGSTLHDDERCAAMTALAASIVGGRGHFLALLDEVQRRRELRTDSPRVREDLAIVADMRARLEARTLRARDLYEYADIMYRAFIWPGHGADDDTIGLIVASAGYKSIGKRTERARTLLNHLKRGDVFPLTADVEENGKGWHVMLAWRGRDGVVRLYDSDKIGRSHVLTSGTPEFERYFDLPTAVWENRSVFRPSL